MKPLRLATGVTTALILAAVSIRTMAAGAPLIEDTTFVVSHDPFGSCGTFELIADGAGTTRTWTYFDGDGVPNRIQFHGLYNGTITNSVTGAFLTDQPSNARITVDLVKGTQTNIGAFFTVTLPGKGVIMFEAGRIVFDGFGTPIFIAGQQHPPSESVALLCDALR